MKNRNAVLQAAKALVVASVASGDNGPLIETPPAPERPAPNPPPLGATGKVPKRETVPPGSTLERLNTKPVKTTGEVKAGKAKSKAGIEAARLGESLDIPAIWSANELTDKGKPVRNQFSATVDACRSALGLAKEALLPSAVFDRIKAHSKEASAAKAAGWHAHYVTLRTKQTERGQLLASGGFAVGRSTTTLHGELPIAEQRRAGEMAISAIRTSLSKMDERFTASTTKTEREDIIERAEDTLKRGLKIHSELSKVAVLGHSYAAPVLPEAIAGAVEKRNAFLKAQAEEMERRRAEGAGKPAKDKAGKVKRKTVDNTTPPIA